MIVMTTDRDPAEIPDSMKLVRGDVQGIECPKCGSRHWDVRRTFRKGPAVNRFRVCRHCGHQIRTAERFVESREGTGDRGQETGDSEDG